MLAIGRYVLVGMVGRRPDGEYRESNAVIAVSLAAARARARVRARGGSATSTRLPIAGKYRRCRGVALIVGHLLCGTVVQGFNMEPKNGAYTRFDSQQ